MRCRSNTEERTECQNFLSRVIEFSRDASKEDLTTLAQLSQMVPLYLEGKKHEKDVQDLIEKLHKLGENLAYDIQISILAKRILEGLET